MVHSTQPAHGHMHDYEGHVEAVAANLEYWRTKRLEPRVIQLHRRGVLTLYDLVGAAARFPRRQPQRATPRMTPRAASARWKMASMNTSAASPSPRSTHPTIPP